MKIMIFIKEEYIRDMQAYIDEQICDNIHDNNKGWKDIRGSVLVGIFNGDSIEAASHFAAQMFPSADSSVFAFYKVS